jgi:hypothetical protein
MTDIKETIKWLEDNGYYNYGKQGTTALCFSRYRADGPKCEWNDKTPQIIVRLWQDSKPNNYDGPCSIVISGCYKGRGVNISIEPISREDLHKHIDKASETIGKMWITYCEGMK